MRHDGFMANLQSFFSTGMGLVIGVVLLVAVAAVIIWAITRTRGTGTGSSYPSVEQKSEQVPPQTDVSQAGALGAAGGTSAPPVEQISEEQPAPELVEEETPTSTVVPHMQEAQPVVPVEQPESVPSRMQRLRSRLAHSGSIGQALLSVLSRGTLKTADWEEIEDTLLMADLG